MRADEIMAGLIMEIHYTNFQVNFDDLDDLIRENCDVIGIKLLR